MSQTVTELLGLETRLLDPPALNRALRCKETHPIARHSSPIWGAPFTQGSANGKPYLRWLGHVKALKSGSEAKLYPKLFLR